MKDSEKKCLNCKWWRVSLQTIFLVRGRCDLSYGSVQVDKNFVCGKFEPTVVLEESEKQ